jgi:hypothetical protein
LITPYADNGVPASAYTSGEYRQIYLPGLSDDEQLLLNHLLQQLHERTPRNLLRASYYDGRRAAVKATTGVIPPQYYKLGLTLGWSAKAVDVLAQRTNVDRFVWPDGDLESLGFTDVWESNYFWSESNAAFVAALIHGVSFLVNTQGEDDEPESLIHIKDAMTATGDFNPRTRQMDNLLSIHGWDEDRTPNELTLYLDGETISAVRDSSGWQVDRVTHDYGVPVEALSYKPSPRRPFGYSRISRPVMSIHDQAIRTLVRMEGHADIFSYPEMWMLGADEKIFRNPDGSLKPSWQVMLGRIKGVPDDPDADPALARADIKQFQAHSPQPHIDLFQQHANNFSGQTSIPVTELGVQARTNTTTADGTDAADRALVRAANEAMRYWTPALNRAMRRALAIQNELTSVPREWQTIAAKWQSPEYVTASAQADAGMKLIAAVPWLADTEVGLELMGLDDQQIARAMSEKRRAMGSATVARAALDALKQQPQVNDFAATGN